MLRYDEGLIGEIHAQGSRGIVGFMLGKLSKLDPRIIAAYADVGSRFGLIQIMGESGLQVSIAEQSLVGIISGICHEGFIPFGVAYAPFITLRAADQIKMSIGEMGLGIKLIGGSAGLATGDLGAASMALDDIAMMRAIPNIMILSPADCFEAAKMIEAASTTDAPFYIRLTGGNNIPRIYNKDYDYRIGKGDVVAETGRDVVIYATGMQVHSSIKAIEMLRKDGIGCTVVNMGSIKPIDEEIICSFADIPLAVSAEEHNVVGGLGSAVADVLAAHAMHQKLVKIGISDEYPQPDTYDNLLNKYGLTPEKIYTKIMNLLFNDR